MKLCSWFPKHEMSDLVEAFFTDGGWFGILPDPAREGKPVALDWADAFSLAKWIVEQREEKGIREE